MSLKGHLKKRLCTRLLLWTSLALLPVTGASADTLMEALAKGLSEKHWPPVSSTAGRAADAVARKAVLCQRR
jgi:hypothetical protein